MYEISQVGVIEKEMEQKLQALITHSAEMAASADVIMQLPLHKEVPALHDNQMRF